MTQYIAMSNRFIAIAVDLDGDRIGVGANPQGRQPPVAEPK
jgi:hypothetical protein